MSEEFINYKFIYNAQSPILEEDECCYHSKPPIPTPDTPWYVIALSLFMVMLFFNHMHKSFYGEDKAFLYHAEKKLNHYIQETLDFYFFNDNRITDEDNQRKEDQDQDQDQNQVKYEDKYLHEFKSLNDEIIFTEDEVIKEIEQRPSSKEALERKLEDNILELTKKIKKVESEMREIEQNMLGDSDNVSRKNDIINLYNKKIKTLNIELELLKTTVISEEEIINHSTEYIINERMNGLKNNIIMEKTPLGNVIMFYNNVRSSFEYYSDNTIPYRYLEVIARKYVVTYNCKRIYVDMSKEIEDAERKLLEKKQKEEDEKKQKEDAENTNTHESKETPKKNVFAKFKTYNKDTSIKSAAVPLDRPAPIKQTKPQEEKIVKERANRYSFEGKLANFSFLKKVDRKVVDKRYAVSFSEFKKMQNNK